MSTYKRVYYKSILPLPYNGLWLSANQFFKRKSTGLCIAPFQGMSGAWVFYRAVATGSDYPRSVMDWLRRTNISPKGVPNSFWYSMQIRYRKEKLGEL